MDEVRTARPDEARDALTGLPRTEVLRQRLGEWHAQAVAGGQRPAVHALLLGLRRFDAVNLAYGAAAGDAALVEIALRLGHFAAEELDGPFLLMRARGGAFLLVANEACSRERWRLFADQLAGAVARPIAVPGGTLRLSPRIALLRGLDGEDADSILDRLGQARDAVQGQSGRRLVWADGEAIRPGRSAAQLEADLLRAIDRDEIEVFCQPQFALADDRLTGAEALARWRHPRLGRMGAGVLFAAAERADHLAPISRHIARLAMLAAAHWPAGLRLSLNVTPADLADAGYARDLAALAGDCGFALDRLTLEVTEQVLLHDIQLARATLGRLADGGARIALDDFGAGFCNFRYLKLLPLHYLKLDRSMIDGIAESPRDLAVLRAIIAMAGALELKVIVEGVESEAQRALVAAEGAAFYQGFFKAQPMAAADFAAFSRQPACC